MCRCLDELRRQTQALAREFDVRGVMNVQYAVRDGVVYVLEVNPRASRTIPFVSKVIGVSLANLATKVMMGVTLKELICRDAPLSFSRVGRLTRDLARGLQYLVVFERVQARYADDSWSRP